MKITIKMPSFHKKLKILMPFETAIITANGEQVAFKGQSYPSYTFTSLAIGEVYWQGEHFSIMTFDKSIDMYRYDEKGHLIATRHRDEPFSLVERVAYGYVTLPDGTQHMAALQLTPTLAEDFEEGQTYRVTSVIRPTAVGATVMRVGVLILTTTTPVPLGDDVTEYSEFETWRQAVMAHDAQTTKKA